MNRKAPIYNENLDFVRTIPFGFVMHYEGVSNFTGKGCAHSVSHPLSELPEDTDIPWWRVVGKQGKYGILRTSGDRRIKQRELLEAEGVVFDKSTKDCRFVLDDYRYRPPMPEPLAA